MTIGSSADDYLQQEINLTPPGSAFPTEDSSTWVALLTAFAQEWARIDANTVLLLNESLPDTTIQLLPNWERVMGLPDDCSTLGDTIEIRRLNLLSKMSSIGGQSSAYLVSVAAKLGYTITITEFHPFQVSRSKVGDAICNKDWWFAFRVNAPLNTVIYFRDSISSAGDPLATWGNTRLECVINKLKPAHTVAIFAYA